MAQNEPGSSAISVTAYGGDRPVVETDLAHGIRLGDLPDGLCGHDSAPVQSSSSSFCRQPTALPPGPRPSRFDRTIRCRSIRTPFGFPGFAARLNEFEAGKCHSAPPALDHPSASPTTPFVHACSGAGSGNSPSARVDANPELQRLARRSRERKCAAADAGRTTNARTLGRPASSKPPSRRLHGALDSRRARGYSRRYRTDDTMLEQL